MIILIHILYNIFIKIALVKLITEVDIPRFFFLLFISFLNN